MNFLFSAEYQSQLANYKKTNLDSRYRLDALCYFVINDNTNTKNETMVNMLFAKNYEDPFKICIDTLNYYDKDLHEEIKTLTHMDSKLYITDINDIEKVCKVLEALIKNIPDDKLSIFESKVTSEIIFNLMKNSKIIKYRRYAFSVLVNYMNILARKGEIQEHIVNLYMNIRISMSCLLVLCHIKK